MDPLLEKKLISTKDASDITGYNSDYLARLCRSGKITGTQVGRTWLVSQASLEEFVKSQGERKQEMREQLSEVREKEYRHAQSPIIKTTRSISPVFTALSNSSSTVSKYLTQPSKLSPFQKQGMAVIGSLVVLLVGITFAQAAPLAKLADRSFATTLAVSEGIHEIAKNAIAGIDGRASHDLAAATKVSSGVVPAISASSSSELASAFVIATPVTNVSSSHSSLFASLDSSAPRLAVRSTDPSQNNPFVAFRNIHSLADASVALAEVESHAYVDTGAAVYVAIENGSASYLNAINASGEATLALGTTVRDFGTTAPLAIANTLAVNEVGAVQAWVGASQNILHAYSDGVYGWVNESPVVTAKIAMTEYQGAYNAGSTLATITAAAPGAVVTGFQEGINGWVTGAPAVTDGVAHAELATGAGIANTAILALDTEKSAVNAGANLAYGAYQQTALAIAGAPSQASSRVATLRANAADAMLGVLGNSSVGLSLFAQNAPSQALATAQQIVAPVINAGAAGTSQLAASIIPQPVLAIGEHTALVTYFTLHGFLENTGNALAFLFGPHPYLAVVPNTTTTTTNSNPTTSTATTPDHSGSTNVTNNTYVTNTNETSGVTKSYVDSAINNLRSAFAMAVIDQVGAAIPHGGNGGPILTYNGVTIGFSKFDKGSITNSAIDNASITNSTFNGGAMTADTLTVTGTSTFNGDVTAATTTVNGLFTVNGDTVFNGGTSTNFNTSNITANDASITNATTTNFFSTLAQATTGIFDNLNATLATIVGLNVTNSTTTNATSTNAFATNISGTNLNVLNATTTNLATTNFTGTNADLTNLSVSATTTTAGLSVGTLNGFLKATAGAISTSLINLASDVSGILPVLNGGTGTSSFATNGIVYGNGTNNLLTTTQGGANTVLVANNGAPSFSSAITVGTSINTPLITATKAVFTDATTTNLTVLNSTTLGSSFTNTLAVNGSVASDLTPNQNKTYNLGAPGEFWKNAYIDTLNVNNLSAASTSISGTLSSSFTLDSGNSTNDTESQSLIFYRGVATPNALLTWNSVAKRFEFNFEVNSPTLTTNGNTYLATNGGSVAIGTTTANPSAILTLSTTTAGFLPPSLTTAQKNAIVNPAPGLEVYDSTVNKLNVFNGTSWKNVGATEISGEVTNGTPGSVLFVGDGGVLGQDNANFNYSTSTGRFGVGTSTPGALFSVNGAGLFNGIVNATTFAGNGTSNTLLTNAGLSVLYADTIGSNVAVGLYDSASGGDNSAVGINNAANTATFSDAFGYGNTASGYLSSAFGSQNTASNNTSMAFGASNNVSGTQSAAFGYNITNAINNTVMIGPSNTSKVTITNNNQVGIGTISPVSQLANTATNQLDSVGNGINLSNGLTWNANGAGYVASFSNAASASLSNGVLINSADTSGNSRLLDVEAAGASKFVVNSNGNVGIGTTTPSTTLSVQGNQYTSGTAFFGGAITATSTLALSNYSGILSSNGASGITARTITGTAGQITVTNGDGIAGNPTISLPSTLSLASASTTLFSVTNKLYVGGTSTTTIDSAGNIVLPSAASLTLGGITANSLPYINGSQQLAAATLPSYLTLTSGTLAISALPNAQLANSTISGVALGGTLGTLTFGTHLTSGGSSYNGSAGVTITTDATNLNTVSTIVARDGSGNFSAGTITAGNYIDSGITANSLPYINGSQQLAAATLPSYITLTTGSLAISQLPIANGGTNATSFTTSGNSVYYNGTALATAPLTSAVTTPYASSTAISVSGSAYFGTLTGTGNSTIAGYLRVGSNSAPNNTTAGDLTATRLSIGNGTFGSTSGDLALYSGSLTETTNTSAVGVGVAATVSPASAATGVDYRSLSMSAQINTANTMDSGTFVDGGYFETRVLNASSIAGATYGVRALGLVVPTAAASLGTVADVEALSATPVNSAGNSLTATITKAIGLHVVNSSNGGTGPLTITGQAGVAIDSLTTGTNNTSVLIGQTTIPTGNFGIYNASTNNNYFAGNVGIGTTSPGTQLGVQGSGVFAGNLTATNITATGTISSTGSGTFGYLTVNGTSDSHFNGSGDVYIGSATGYALLGGTPDLSVAGEINANASVIAAGGSYSQPAYQFYSSSNTGLFNTGSNGTSGIGFSVQGVEKGRFDSTGNFGIGTTTPGTKLGVQGSGVFAGNLTATNITATGTLAIAGTATVGNLIDTGLTANSLPYVNGSQQFAAATLPSYITLTTGTLAISQLPIANGGTNATSFTTSGNAVYFNGASLVTAPTTAAVTTPYASSTAISVTGSAYFATGGGLVGIGTTSPFARLSVDTSNLGVGIPSFVVGSSTRTDLLINQAGQLTLGGGSPVSSATQLTILPTSSGNIRRVGQGTLNNGGSYSADKVIVQGRYAYIVEGRGTTNAFEVWDVSVPASPVRISQSTLNNGNADGDGLDVQGRYAYITEAAGTTNAFEIWDVSNPKAPVRVGQGNLTNSYTIGEGDTVVVQGRYAYITDAGTTNAFQIWDVSNPTAPVRVGQGNIANNNTNGAISMTVRGSYAYIDNGGTTNGLEIWDVSNPTNPVRVGVGTLNTGSAGTGIVLQGRYAYLVQGNGTTNAFEVWDVSNPASPARVGQANLTNGGLSTDRIAVQGRYAYVVEGQGTTNAFEVFDVSNPVSPVRVAQGNLNNGGNSGNDIVVQGRYAYIVEGTGTTNAFEIWDLGGAYIQQLETGGIETGSLAVNGLLSGVSANLSGGLNVGNGGIFSAGPLSVGVASSTQANAISATFQGLVGIGTTSPYANLAIQNPYGNTNTTLFAIGSSTSSTGATASTFLSVLSSGNIGIGTTTPGTQLGVQGNGVFAGNITATNITATGTLAVAGTATVANLIDTGITANSLPYINGSQQLAAATLPSYITLTTGTLAISQLPIAQGGTNAISFTTSGNAVYFNGASLVTAPTTAAVTTPYASSTAISATGSAYFATSGGLVGVGTTSPYANLSIQNNYGSTNAALLSVASSTAANGSTASTFLALNSTGQLTIGNGSPVSSTTQLTILPNTSNNIRRVGQGNLNNGVAWSGASVTVQGRYAYVVEGGATTNAFEIWDVTVPASPVRVGQGTLNNFAQDHANIVVQGRYAYITDGGGTTNAFEVWDVANPAAPVRVGQGTPNYIGTGLSVQGRYAYLADGAGTTNAFEIWDVSNPALPVRVGQGNLNNAGSFNLHDTVVVQGKYAYVADGTATTNAFEVWDVSNPVTPIRVGQANLAYGGNYGTDGLAVQGRYAYVTEPGGTTNAFEIFDLSNPASPTRVGQGTTLVGNNAGSTVSIQGRYAYMVNGSGTSNAFEVWDVSNPVSPVRVASGNLNNGNANANISKDGISIQGRYAYIAEGTGPTGAFEIWDLGGAYIQQFEAGGIETGSLAVNGLLSGVSANLSGGLNVGNGGIFSSGPLSVGISSSTQTNAISATFQGLVGIGTTSPYANLAIQNPYGNTNTTLFAIGSSTSSTGATASTFLSVLSSGNVGIGTTTPGTKLGVQGDGVFAGNLTATNITATGTISVVGTVNALGSGAALFTYDRSGGGNYSGIYRTGGVTSLYDNSAGNVLTFNSSANVGIGTAVLAGRFQVGGGRSYFAANSEPFAVGAAYNSSGGAVYFGATSGSATPDVQISNSAGAALMTLQNNGNVSIGAAASALGKLYVKAGTNTNLSVTSALTVAGAVSLANLNDAGNGWGPVEIYGNPVEVTGGYLYVRDSTIYDTDGAVHSTSDQRLKENISTISGGDALQKLDELNPVTYNWINPSVHGNTQAPGGFLAQQLATVFPEFVSTTTCQGADCALVGSDSSEYSIGLTPKFDAYLVAGIQELNARTQVLTSTSTLASAFSGVALNASSGITASSYEVSGAAQTLQNTFSGVSFASTTITSVLTADGTGVDVYKLATFTLSGVQQLALQGSAFQAQADALASTTNSIQNQVTSLSARVSALEAGASAGLANATSTSVLGANSLLSATSTQLASALESFGVLLQNGIAQFNTLVVRNLVFSKDANGTSAAGSGTVLAGNTTVEIDNANMLATSQVSVTLTAPLTGNWYVSDKQDGKFRVTLSAPQTADVTFDYIIVQTQGQIATSTPTGYQGSAFSWINALFGGGSSSTPTTGGTVSAGVSGSSSATGASNGGTTGSTSSGTASSTSGTTGGVGAPSVILNGSPAISLNVGDVFLDPGATAHDATGADISSSIHESGSVDTATPGIYTLTYTATDGTGNTGSASRVVTVSAGGTVSGDTGNGTGTSASSASGTTSGSGTSSAGSTTSGSDTSGGSSPTPTTPSAPSTPAPTTPAAPISITSS